MRKCTGHCMQLNLQQFRPFIRPGTQPFPGPLGTTSSAPGSEEPIAGTRWRCRENPLWAVLTGLHLHSPLPSPPPNTLAEWVLEGTGDTHQLRAAAAAAAGQTAPTAGPRGAPWPRRGAVRGRRWPRGCSAGAGAPLPPLPALEPRELGARPAPPTAASLLPSPPSPRAGRQLSHRGPGRRPPTPRRTDAPLLSRDGEDAGVGAEGECPGSGEGGEILGILGKPPLRITHHLGGSQ